MTTTCQFLPDSYKTVFPINLFFKNSMKVYVVETFPEVWELKDLLTLE